MKIQELVYRFNKLNDSNSGQEQDILINKIIKRRYIPYLKKVECCKNIVSKDCYDEKGIYNLSSPSVYFDFIMNVIDLYTHIEYEKSDSCHAFDLLSQTKILSCILNNIGDDIKDFNTLLTMMVNDCKQNDK